ncbi:hypothetical protein SDC9_189591 [bioreactor metagenome]|uniref:Thioredoxin-like fold domain-containing protein n=1 Tax=bioreactor metagenome TaxID=1076179 RepID=A0A645HSL1_9ZZZZ
MKPILMFTMKSCPHCVRAMQWMDELKQENPAYTDLDIKIIDETIHPDIAGKYDYYYVPTYFVDGVKVHEGVPGKDRIRAVFQAAYD